MKKIFQSRDLCLRTLDTNSLCAKKRAQKGGKDMKEYRMETSKEKMSEENSDRKRFREFLREEDGMGTVEIILIVVVLISLVIIFKRQLTSLVNTVFDKINDTAGSI